MKKLNKSTILLINKGALYKVISRNERLIEPEVVI